MAGQSKHDTTPRRDTRDGTWIGELCPGGNAGRHTVPHRVRVIDYTIDDGRSNDTTYRLFTTILDPADATAADELKTHQRGSKIVLRSKSPEWVRQEIWRGGAHRRCNTRPGELLGHVVHLVGGLRAAEHPKR